MQTPKLTQLYLKQFFCNFTLRQKHSESVSLLSSSLEVLEVLVAEFAHRNSIGIKEQRQQQESLSATFERLYMNLSSIFQAINPSNIAKSRREEADGLFDVGFNKMKQPCDDQLYEILNDYKSTNKKLKETVQAQGQKLESKGNQLMQMILARQKTEREIQHLQQSVEDLQAQIKELVGQAERRQENMKQLQIQNDEIRKSNQRLIADKIDISQTLQKLAQQHQQLEHKYLTLQQQNSQLKGTISQMNEQQSLQINKKLGEIPNLVQQRMASEELINRSSAQILSKFLKYSLANPISIT